MWYWYYSIWWDSPGVMCSVGFDIPLLEGVCFAVGTLQTACFHMMLIGGVFPWLHLCCVLLKAHF